MKDEEEKLAMTSGKNEIDKKAKEETANSK